MTRPRDEQSPLSFEDAAIVERLKESFTPDPLGSSRRAAFDAALAARLVRRSPLRRGAPALMAVALAALVAWLLAPSGAGPSAPGSPGSAPRVAEAGSSIQSAAWEDELLDAVSFSEVEDPDEGEQLPDDYATIAAILLDG